MDRELIGHHAGLAADLMILRVAARQCGCAAHTDSASHSRNTHIRLARPTAHHGQQGCARSSFSKAAACSVMPCRLMQQRVRQTIGCCCSHYIATISSCFTAANRLGLCNAAATATATCVITAGLTELRSKFEEDKARVAKLKATHAFKPY